ncbi:MAG: TetR/AcrR family transcriptional regulator C-terminal domain-containing protein [Acidimicrobiia bacterium]|nr:TetR/AcrR family transcriptional regulator C-terminal domain-containing protein [Acidimicrobiia bacterium]
MVTDADAVTTERAPLSKTRVLEAAMNLADRSGIETLTMRNLAQELGVEAMSLYYHVANKEALLDGLVDSLLTEIEQERGDFEVVMDQGGWLPTMRSLILTARTVMLRHPWAPRVIESRTTMTPTLLRYFNALLGIMIEGGFSNDLGHHAMHALGSRALGFNQELFEPDNTEQGDEAAEAMMADLASQLPYLMGMLAEVVHDDPDTTLGWCDDQTEFEFGLDLLLTGLEARRADQ